MATIKENRNKAGEIISYKVTVCVGRDPATYKQVWRTCTLPRPEGLTPKKEEKAVQLQADLWAEAQKAEFEKNNKARSQNKDKAKMPLVQFIRDRWLPYHGAGKLTPATQAFYGYMADDFCSYFGDRVRIGELDRETVEKYEVFLRTKARTKAGKPLSETSIRRHLETLRNVTRYALKNGYMKDDVFRTYTIETKADVAATVDFLTPDEAKHFLECLESESTFWKAYTRISLNCGLRRGEMIALTWGDVDLDNFIIHVRKNVTVDVHSETGYHIGATKAKQQRKAVITKAIAQLLVDLKAEYEARYGEQMPDAAFVFCTPENPHTPIYPTTPTTWLKRFEKKNGLREVSPHDLRHSAGSLAKIAGADLKDIQVMLGHSDLKTTAKFYLGADEAALRRTASAVESLIDNNE